MRFFRFTAPLLLFSHFSQAIETRQPMTADVYSLRPGIRSQHHQPLQPPHRTDGKKMGRDLYQAPPSAVSCVTALASARILFTACRKTQAADRVKLPDGFTPDIPIAS